MPEDTLSVEDTPLFVSGWNAIPQSKIDPEELRTAIREERVLDISYRDEQDRITTRALKPLAIIYYIDAVVVGGWCGLRRDFRHFRIDRIIAIAQTARSFKGEGMALRKAWECENRASHFMID